MDRLASPGPEATTATSAAGAPSIKGQAAFGEAIGFACASLSANSRRSDWAHSEGWCTGFAAQPAAPEALAADLAAHACTGGRAALRRRLAAVCPPDRLAGKRDPRPCVPPAWLRRRSEPRRVRRGGPRSSGAAAATAPASASDAAAANSRDCVLDAHARWPVLALGPHERDALCRMWANWGTTWPLRRAGVVEGGGPGGQRSRTRSSRPIGHTDFSCTTSAGAGSL